MLGSGTRLGKKKGSCERGGGWLIGFEVGRRMVGRRMVMYAGSLFGVVGKRKVNQE